MPKPVKVTLEFDDGTTEVHDTSDGGYYRTFNTHREDENIKGRVVEFWTAHTIGWNEGRIGREQQQPTAQMTANS